MAYWLLRSEPDAYGWADLVRDGGTEWDGVRNNTAAQNLRAMAVGDRAILYHSVTEKAAVGIAEITRTARKDGTEGNWVSVAIKPVELLARPVPLAEIKASPALREMAMVRQSRLSVSAVTPDEWAALLRLAG